MTHQPSKEFFTNLHDVECNQKYADTLPYSFHLNLVYLQGEKFKDVICKILEKEYGMTFTKYELPREVKDSLWGHDSIEDARLTYNDIKELYGALVADVIYLCTDFKGKNRAERKPEQFYKELMTEKVAVFVKLCDLIANIKYSLLVNSSMYDKYKAEWTETKFKLIDVSSEFKEMFLYINKLVDVH